MLDVALLGTGGMMPLPGRYLTSLMLRLEGRMMLIDCGECTQVTMKLLAGALRILMYMLYSLPRRPYFRFARTSFDYWKFSSYRTPYPCWSKGT